MNWQQFPGHHKRKREEDVSIPLPMNRKTLDLELKPYRSAPIERTLEGDWLEIIHVGYSVAESDVLVDGSQRTGVGHVERIEGELDLIPLTQLERVVGVQIELIVRGIGADGSTAADRDFAGIGVNRMRAELADRCVRNYRASRCRR